MALRCVQSTGSVPSEALRDCVSTKFEIPPGELQLRNAAKTNMSFVKLRLRPPIKKDDIYRGVFLRFLYRSIKCKWGRGGMGGAYEALKSRLSVI